MNAIKRLMIAALAAALCLCLAGAPALAEAVVWDDEVSLADEAEIREKFTANFASSQNERRADRFEYSWKVADGALHRTNNVDAARDTVNIAMLTYTQAVYDDFELSVEVRAGSKTAYWPVVGIRQQIPGKYYVTPGGGAGIFMQQNGKITAWGPIVSGGAVMDNLIEQDISDAANYYPGQWHTLGIRVQGTTVEVSLDGRLELTLAVANTDYIKGYVSLLSINNDCSFRNFRIRSLSGAAQTGNEPNRSPYAEDGTALEELL